MCPQQTRSTVDLTDHTDHADHTDHTPPINHTDHTHRINHTDHILVDHAGLHHETGIRSYKSEAEISHIPQLFKRDLDYVFTATRRCAGFVSTTDPDQQQLPTGKTCAQRNSRVMQFPPGKIRPIKSPCHADPTQHTRSTVNRGEHTNHTDLTDHTDDAGHLPP